VKHFSLTLLFLAVAICALGQVSGPQSTSGDPSNSPAQANEAAPTAATKTAADTQADVDKLRQDYKTAQQDHDKQVATLTTEIQQLTTQVTRLSNEQSPQIQMIVSALQDRITNLEKVSQASAKNQLDFAKVQYQAGYKTLDALDANLRKLNFAVKLAESINAFQSATNPAHNAQFQAVIQELQGAQDKGTSGLTLPGPLMANPYVSLAVGIASLFTSKLNATKKTDNLGKLQCVINAGTAGDADVKIMAGDLKTLGDKITSQIDSADSVFQNYSNAVSASMKLSDYRQSSAGGRDPLTNPIERFWAPDGGIAKAENRSTVEYQINQVRGRIQLYEGVIGDVSQFLAKFTGTVQTLGKTLTPTCDASSDVLKSLTALGNDLASVKGTYDGAIWDVGGPIKSVLYGTAQ
jgi:hypothetical protein